MGGVHRARQPRRQTQKERGVGEKDEGVYVHDDISLVLRAKGLPRRQRRSTRSIRGIRHSVRTSQFRCQLNARRPFDGFRGHVARAALTHGWIVRWIVCWMEQQEGAARRSRLVERDPYPVVVAKRGVWGSGVRSAISLSVPPAHGGTRVTRKRALIQILCLTFYC
jgi:hypothetical protein